MSGEEHDPKDMLRAGLAAPLFTATDRGPHLRIATPFALPDGDLLTLFVLRHSDPPLLGDLGETLRWVRSHSFHDPPGVPGERAVQQIAGACDGLGVALHVGELRTQARPGESLAAALVRLAQACLRVASLRRGGPRRTAPPFADEVEAQLRATLRERPLHISRNDRIAGISATTWSVDFRVRTAQRQVLLFLLASGRRDQARKLAEHVVAACTDLAHLRKLRRTPVQFVTVFDDRGAAWSDADARLVAPFATPVRWSERATWMPALEAPDPEEYDDYGDPDPEDPDLDEPPPHSDDEPDHDPPRPLDDDPDHDLDEPGPTPRRSDDETDLDEPGPMPRHSDDDPDHDPDEPSPMPRHSDDDPDHAPLHTRPATRADYPLFARLFPELGVSDPVPDLDAWDDRQRASTLVHALDGVPVGYSYFEVMDGVGYVRNVALDPGVRGRGLGRPLMRALADELRARGCDRWCLNVRPDNLAAVRLYERVGLRVAYRSAALRFPWSVVEALPGDDLSLATCQIDPAEDAAVEAAFALPRGQLASLRAKEWRVMLRLQDPADPARADLGFASFDPHFPGAYPLRVASPGHARALLLALRPHALPEPPYMQVVVEDDEPLRELLLAAGAALRLDIVFMRGALPGADDSS